ncbi:MAG: hypothetical protein ABIF11_00295 [Nitrospirota bacterium]
MEPALNIFQRAKLSFGDPSGRRKYLERLGYEVFQETPEGNYIVKNPQGQFKVTDPRGLDKGDLGDIVGGLFPLAGWIGGAGLGATMAAPTILGIPTGAAIGGATGAARGQSLRQTIGKGLGVIGGGPVERAKEIGKEALMAGATELGIGGVQKYAVKPIKEYIGKPIWKKAIQPFIENIFQFTADIPKKATDYAIKHNPLKIITRQFRAEEFPNQLVKQIEEGSKITLDALQSKWKTVVNPIKNNIKNVIDYNDVLSKAKNIFVDFGIITHKGVPKESFIKGTPRYELLQDVWGNMVKYKNKTMPVNLAMQARQEIDAIINKGFKDNIFTEKDIAALKQVRRYFNDQIHTKFPVIAKIDEAYSTLYDAFKIIDIDWSNPKALSQLEKTIKKFPELPIAIQNAFKSVNAQMPQEYKFLDNAIKYWTAMQYEPTVLRGIRAGLLRQIIGPLIGGSVGAATGGPLGASIGAGIGLGVSTPRIVGGIMRSGTRALQVPRTAQKFIPSVIRALQQK